jgi:hypothetical protein
MNATHWGYEYLQEMVKQEQAYLEEMIGALAPESHMALVFRDMRDRMSHGLAIAAEETRKQERFNAGPEPRPAEPVSRGGFWAVLTDALHAH